MAHPLGDATNPSLLLRLRQAPGDATAWKEFVGRYGRQVFVWCRRWGLQDADAEDVTQNVLAVLAERLRSFEYDPGGSFRAWLKTVAYHAWGKYVAQLGKPGRGEGSNEVNVALATLAARDDLAARIEEEFDRELLDVAMVRIAQRVEPHTWQAFTLTSLEGLTGPEAAARLSIPLAMVYVAKSRVQKMLKDEIRQLETAKDDAR